MRVEIPRTIGAAGKRLGSLDKLATATEWERAAIVAAFVREGGGRGRDRSGDPPTYSILQFAKLGHVGLKQEQQVRRYVKAWDRTGRERPEPGDAVSLPTDPWRFEPRSEGQNLGDVRRVIKREGARAVVQALHPSERRSLSMALADEGMTRSSTKPARSTTKNANLAALNALADMGTSARRANELVDYASLSDHDRKNAEIAIQATETEIAVWREQVEGGISDEAIRRAITEV